VLPPHDALHDAIQVLGNLQASTELCYRPLLSWAKKKTTILHLSPAAVHVSTSYQASLLGAAPFA
jgi:hypothetical protein